MCTAKCENMASYSTDYILFLIRLTSLAIIEKWQKKETEKRNYVCEKCFEKLGCCKYFPSISWAHGKIMFQPFVFPVKTKSQVTTFSTLQLQNSSNYAESNQISAESTPISYLDVESFQIDQEPLKKIWKTTNQFHSCLVDDLPNNANVWCNTYTN